MKYFLTIGGRSFEFKQIHFRREASYDPQTCELLILPARNVTLPAQGDLIIITKEMNNVKMEKWRGRVNTIQQIPLIDGTVKVIGYDLLKKSQYVNVANIGYNNQKGSTILATEIAPNSVTDLTPGTIDTSDSILDTVNFGKTLNGVQDSKIDRLSAIKMLTAMSGRDIYIHRDGTVDLSNSSGSGTDRSSTMVLEHGLNGNILPDVGYSEDETRRVKQVIIKGQGVGTNYVIGSAGTPASTDKVRQIEMAFVQSNSIANSVAQSVLNELNQTFKYTKFELIDIFSTNYDVFDKVTLKARFPTKTVNTTMKIYSIDTIVSNGLDNLHETVTLELASFLRGVWAETVIKTKVEESQSQTDSFNIGTTLATVQINPMVVSETLSTVAPAEIDNSVEVEIENITFSSDLNMGVFVIMDLDILCMQESTGGVLDLRFYDGTSYYPSGSNRIRVAFNPFVGQVTKKTVTYFIPKNVKSATIHLYGIVESGGKVQVIPRDVYYTVGQ